ncbi:MAG: zinc-finger domain-containing protein [Alphaproteobacteria bacterium]|jgi:uncharacterized Zn-finger protein|nr:zinc-finger domain-containing protein [Alphaproteobacteria bacterium]
MENNKSINVNTREVSCSGDSYSKHPHVYLKIAKDKKEVVCPYCSRSFYYIANQQNIKK